MYQEENNFDDIYLDANDFNFDYNLDYNLDVNNVENDLQFQDLQVFVNSAPTINSISNVTKSENLTVGSTIATASASDADGDTLTYSLTVDQSGNLAINDNGVITLASAFADVTQDTNYNVTVRATDGTDDAKADFVLTVTADGTLSLASGWVTTGDGTSGDYKQTIAYAGTGDGRLQINKLGHQSEAYNASYLSQYDVVAYYNSANYSFANSPFSTALTSWVNDLSLIHI